MRNLNYRGEIPFSILFIYFFGTNLNVLNFNSIRNYFINFPRTSTHNLTNLTIIVIRPRIKHVSTEWFSWQEKKEKRESRRVGWKR